MQFDGLSGQFLLKTESLRLYKITIPFVVAREIWENRNPGRPLSDANLRAWMSCSFNAFLPLYSCRIGLFTKLPDANDCRVNVTPIAKSSAQYKAAITDKGVISADQSNAVYRNGVA